MILKRRAIEASALACAIAVLLLGPLVAPAVGQDSDATGTDKSTVIQVLNVVENEDGTVVAEVAIPGVIGDLAPVDTNFGIAYNGDLVDFDVAPVSSSLDVVIAIDTSGSMRGNALRDAKLAAASFIDSLPEDSNVAVLGFGETVDVLAELTSDRTAALASVDDLVAIGETRLWDGLIAAADLAATNQDSIPYVVVLSDGDDSISDASQQEAVERLEGSNVGLYAVAITSGEATGESLNDAVESAGGIFASINESGQLTTLYDEIADRLSSRYQLTFRRDPSSSGTAVISVAVDSSIATARTRVSSVEELSSAPGDVDPDPEGPATVLNIPADSRLGSVPALEPGLFGQSLMLPIGAAAFFVAILIVGYLVLNPTVDVRLEAAASADRVAGINERLSGLAQKLVERRDTEGELDKALDAAGLNLRPGEFLMMSAVATLVTAMLGWLVGGVVLGFALAGLTIALIFAYLSRAATRQRAKFADQLTDTLGILSGSIRAGRGLPQAIELVASEAPSPTADQFRRIMFETQVGRDMTVSMMDVAERMKNAEFLWIARAFDINRELGGDLTEILENIAETIRDRRRIDRMVQALSAEGRASGWIMLALPVLMFLFLLWRSPDSASILMNTNLGRLLLAAALLGMVVGWFWIRRLVDLKY